MKILTAFFILCFVNLTFAQTVKVLNSHKSDVSFRGLSVVDDFTLWISGSKGTIGFSLNGGKTFNWVNPPGYENRDFRAIEAIDYQTAIAVAIGSPALILQTKNQGKVWDVVYQDNHPDVFLDAVHFALYNPKLGISVGDPIDNQPYILKTIDGGETWRKMEINELTEFEKGEAFFAASNSNLYILDDTTFYSVTGGTNSRLIINSGSPQSIDLPKAKTLTAGANALDYRYFSDFGLIVGGDFEKPESFTNNLFIFEIKDQTTPKITLPQTAPRGYKSGVSIINDTKAISCGPIGVDLTKDKGKNWKNFSEIPFHACKKAKKGNSVYLVGSQGRIGKYFD